MNRRGSALVETALLLPLAMFLLLGVTDAGRLCSAHASLAAAARAASQHAVREPAATAAALEQTAQQAAGDPRIHTSVRRFCQCAHRPLGQLQPDPCDAGCPERRVYLRIEASLESPALTGILPSKTARATTVRVE
jgi:hypothetical protein